MTTMLDRYTKASTLAPERLSALMKNRTIEPSWSADGTAVIYRRDREAGGHEFVKVNATTGQRSPMFDHATLASQLGDFLGETVSSDALPIRYVVEGTSGELRLSLIDGQTLELTNDGRLVAMAASVGTAISSPDGKYEIFRREHDIWLRDCATDEERQLTTDGEKWFAWGALPDNNMIHIPMKKMGAQLPPAFSGFSPSQRLVVTARVDERSAGEWPFVEQLPADGARPRLHTIRGVLEDENSDAVGELAFVDLATGSRFTIPLAEDIAGGFTMTGVDSLTWSDDETRIYLLAHRTGTSTASLVEIEIATGERRTVLSETDSSIYEPNTYLYSLPLVRVLPKSRDVIWFSQRDGWGHLYRYDLETGECTNAITQGNIVVRDILWVGEESRELVILANVDTAGENPYWRRVFRVDLDGRKQVLLTPEPCDHELPSPAPQFFSLIFGAGKPVDAPVSPDGNYFIDHMSTVSDAPEIVLRDARDGRILAPLERTDITALLDAGYPLPQQFCVKTADGRADIWGIITLPPDPIDPTLVPVVDLMYAGFQVAWQPPGFLGNDLSSRAGAAAGAYAHLGIATVVLDGRGTSGRYKEFRQWTHGNSEPTRGLEDHVAAITALKASHPTIDLDRVGVTGHSYGGYNSARSLLLFPEFFKVAVSSAGVHVPEKMPNGSWAWHVGADVDKSSSEYQTLSNINLVPRLAGKLLLLFGDLDENATLDHSFALVNALIAHGKRFDMKIWPGINHYGAATPYPTMCTWDYFVEHLLGITPPEGFIPN